MPEYLSIKERIERRLCAILRAAQVSWLSDELAAGRISTAERDAAGVHRWDARGKRSSQSSWAAIESPAKSFAHLDILLLHDDEEVAEGADGNIGYTDKTQPMAAAVIIKQAENSGEITIAVVNRWLARLEAALTADPNVTESGGPQLAIDLQITGTRRPPLEEGQRECVAAVEFAVTYQHERNTPYALGTLIAAALA